MAQWMNLSEPRRFYLETRCSTCLRGRVWRLPEAGRCLPDCHRAISPVSMTAPHILILGSGNYI